MIITRQIDRWRTVVCHLEQAGHVDLATQALGVLSSPKWPGPTATGIK